MSEFVIEMEHIRKEFPGVVANDDVTLRLKKGEIHALLGENGAGKSTLMSVLFGLYRPERGVIKKNGQQVNIEGPNDANALGIGMVHQHFKLVDVFTVLENIILGHEPNKYGFLTPKEAKQKVLELSERYNLHIDIDAKIEDISVGMQQRVEILKMLYRENEILIFDEPTAVLTPQEIEELMDIMRELTKEGKSIIFISHKLKEIMNVSDRVTVLRKGKGIGTVSTDETSIPELSKMMVGRKIKDITPSERKVKGEKVLEVKNLCVPHTLHENDAVKNVDFHVEGGEIVSIAGIEGNGQTELIYAISGLRKPSGGRIIFKEKDITEEDIRTRNKMGMSHIPEDRHKHGLILDFTLEDNLALKRYWREPFQKHHFIQRDVYREYANDLIERYDIRSGRGAITTVGSMSGGNQQKAIIAREFEDKPALILAVQPTRGLDVGAIEYIHEELIDQRNEGKAILLVSLEIEEVLDIADRILIMYDGEIVAELKPDETSPQEMGEYMIGAKKQKNTGDETGDAS